MSKILLKGGRVIDPVNKRDEIADLLIAGSSIEETGQLRELPGMKVINVTGKVVVPGLIDMHVHLREPGGEDAETIETGTRAAAKGGITTCCCMPNTNPVIDNQGVVSYIYQRTKEVGSVNVFPIGSVTRNQEGRELAEIGNLKQAGVVAISDDGHPISDSGLMRRALEYSRMFDLPIIVHSEDQGLSAGGVMHEGYVATMLGLPGIPALSEEVMVARDLRLVELTGGRIHFAHITTAGSVALIREAKARGVQVTCETTPHHFTLTDEAVSGFDTDTKVNPPLRTAADVAAVKEGLKDGTIDVIASDHAPHTRAAKEVEYSLAPFGMVGLETLFPLTITQLVAEKVLSLPQAIAKLTANPARILKLDKGSLSKGSLSKGADADVTVIDPGRKFILEEDTLISKSKNTPFVGWKLQGVPETVIVRGKVVVKEGDFV